MTSSGEYTAPIPEPSAIYCILREFLDPEIGMNVVDLGMIGEVGVEPSGAVTVEVMPTTAGCPMHDALAEGVARFVGSLPGVTAVDVRFVHEPPWTPDRIAPEARAILGMA